MPHTPPTVEELYRGMGRMVVRFYGRTPGSSCVLASNAILGCSGLGSIFLNCGVLFGDGPAGDDPAEARLREFVARIRERGIGGYVCLSETIQRRLEPLAQELGLEALLPVPLMALSRPPGPVATGEEPGPSGGPAVERVAGAAGLAEFLALSEAAFDLPADLYGRVMTTTLLEDPLLTVYLSRLDGAAVAGVVVVDDEGLAGISGWRRCRTCKVAASAAASSTTARRALAAHPRLLPDGERGRATPLSPPRVRDRGCGDGLGRAAAGRRAPDRLTRSCVRQRRRRAGDPPLGQRSAARLAQPPEEALAEEAVLAERAELLEQRHRDGEREHAGRQSVAHGDVRAADHRLRRVEVAERYDELGTARPERHRHRVGLAPCVMVVGAVLQHAELVGVRPEGDRLEIPGQLRLERPDQDVAVLGMVRRRVVHPLRHQLAARAKPLVPPEEVDEVVALARLDAEEGPPAAAAAEAARR